MISLIFRLECCCGRSRGKNEQILPVSPPEKQR
jgi:hypothetical protein